MSGSTKKVRAVAVTNVIPVSQGHEVRYHHLDLAITLAVYYPY